VSPGIPEMVSKGFLFQVLVNNMHVSFLNDLIELCKRIVHIIPSHSFSVICDGRSKLKNASLIEDTGVILWKKAVGKHHYSSTLHENVMTTMIRMINAILSRWVELSQQYSLEIHQILAAWFNIVSTLFDDSVLSGMHECALPPINPDLFSALLTCLRRCHVQSSVVVLVHLFARLVGKFELSNYRVVFIDMHLIVEKVNSHCA
jgi:hypothetical protein